LKCCLELLKVAQKCPECSCDVTEGALKQLKVSWQDISGEFDALTAPTEKEVKVGDDSLLYISMIDGQTIDIRIPLTATVNALKAKIQTALKVNSSKQCLVYNGKDLKGTDALSSVKNGATIQLLIVMLDGSELAKLSAVNFDLSWGYPLLGRDYLDGSCLAFAGKTLVGTADYANRSSVDGLRHSGDMIDDRLRLGHHVITVDLTKLPAHVTHLYFTLSAFSTTRMGDFPTSSVRVFQPSDSSKELSGYVLPPNCNYRAVVMCCLVRAQPWKVMRLGKMCDGNASNYRPIVDTARGLMV